MDRSRIHRAATGKKKGGSAMPRRLLVYGFAGIALLAWIVFDNLDREPTVERPDAPLESVDDLPAFDATPRANVDPALLADVRDATPAERVQLEREARVHLMEQASTLIWGDLEKLGLRHVPHDELLAEPARHRGEPIWALGRVRWIDQSMVDGLLEVRGELRDEQERSWLFIVLTEPYDIEVGDVVRVPGFFFKHARMLDHQGEFVDGPLVVGEELLPSSFRIPPVTELTPELRERLRRVRDYSLEGASQRYGSQVFYELLSFVKHGSEEAVFPTGSPPPEVAPTELLRFAARHRAEPVRLTGMLLEKRRTLLGPRGENPLGVPQVYELWLNDARAGKNGNVLALSLEDPGDFQRGDIVEVDGLFFRRWAYENRLNEPRMSTLLLARRAQPFVPLVDPVPGILRQAIIGIVGGLALLLFLAQWREKRGSTGARASRIKRKSKLVQRELTRGEEPGAPSDAT